MSKHVKPNVNRLNNKATTTKRVATGGLLVALVAGGGTAAAAQKSVTVDVDGEIQQVSTIFGDDARILDKAGVEVADGNADVVQGDGHERHATEGRLFLTVPRVDARRLLGWSRCAVRHQACRLGVMPRHVGRVSAIVRSDRVTSEDLSVCSGAV